MGGSDDDPINRVMGPLAGIVERIEDVNTSLQQGSGVSDQLKGIQTALANAAHFMAEAQQKRPEGPDPTDVAIGRITQLLEAQQNHVADMAMRPDPSQGMIKSIVQVLQKQQEQQAQQAQMAAQAAAQAAAQTAKPDPSQDIMKKLGDAVTKIKQEPQAPASNAGIEAILDRQVGMVEGTLDSLVRIVQAFMQGNSGPQAEILSQLGALQHWMQQGGGGGGGIPQRPPMPAPTFGAQPVPGAQPAAPQQARPQRSAQQQAQQWPPQVYPAVGQQQSSQQQRSAPRQQQQQFRPPTNPIKSQPAIVTGQSASLPRPISGSSATSGAERVNGPPTQPMKSVEVNPKLQNVRLKPPFDKK